jgi:1,4-dihydroxy-2-naphthoate octaprenyltransferase
VLAGKKTASVVYVAVTATVYVAAGLLVAFKVYPAWSLIAFLTLPVAIKAIMVMRRHYGEIRELLPANRLTIVLHAATGLLIVFGFVLSWC